MPFTSCFWNTNTTTMINNVAETDAAKGNVLRLEYCVPAYCEIATDMVHSRWASTRISRNSWYTSNTVNSAVEIMPDYISS
jgi:hypothetical protein